MGILPELFSRSIETEDTVADILLPPKVVKSEDAAEDKDE